MPAAASSADLDRVLGDFLRRLACLDRSRSLDDLAELDLSISQARALMMTARCQAPVALHQIADELDLSLPATGRSVDRLVSEGLVLREEDSEDRRVRLVSLTDRGRAVVSQHLDQRRRTVREFTRRLTVSERDHLYRALEPILAGDSLSSTCKESP